MSSSKDTLTIDEMKTAVAMHQETETFNATMAMELHLLRDFHHKWLELHAIKNDVRNRRLQQFAAVHLSTAADTLENFYNPGSAPKLDA